jgi:hypothetical protein
VIQKGNFVYFLSQILKTREGVTLAHDRQLCLYIFLFSSFSELAQSLVLIISSSLIYRHNSPRSELSKPVVLNLCYTLEFLGNISNIQIPRPPTTRILAQLVLGKSQALVGFTVLQRILTLISNLCQKPRHQMVP